ncbi:Replication factor-A carboxy-terminal domain protein [Rhynchospora pubera]|uniref:Replication factor-A carboxy-terminal domain protein n=1 Tax=Rhynchospora pubera TaxID=906938 RepID=A0AAV8HKX2_9POAL|nr:Replication factor-A carboxy-terminal domain protein [Rhynchospora pubera]
MTTPLPMTTIIDPPVPVLTLTPTTDTENVRIHGRPVRIWEAADARFGRVYNMAFLFIDHTGSKIQGLIPVPEYQRQSAVFREDSLCEITRFTLEGSTRDYQVVKHPYMLSLTRETVVTMLQPGLYDIPTTHFDFVSFREIGVSVTHLKAVIDVIGRIVGFSDVVLTTGSQPSRVRGMYLADNDTPHDGMPITLHATAQTYNIHVVTPHRADPIKVTMAQLMGLYLDNYNENYYQCAGVIMNINNRFDWYYESCPDCRRKLGKNGGHLWCDHCSARRPNSIPWYKIRVQAVDQTGDAQFVLLGRLGEQAVGMPAQAVVALQQQDRKITPAPLIGIVGKKFMFTFAGKQRVPYQENRIYTVVDLAPVPPELLDLLPQPILHIEAAPLFASASSTPIAEGEPHTPPHQSIATASPASPQIGHSLAKQSSAHTPTEQYATLADARGKRPLLKEQDTPDQPAATIKRKLDFDEPPADTLQRYVSNLYSRT